MSAVALKHEQFAPHGNRVLILPDGVGETFETESKDVVIHRVTQEATEVPTWGTVKRVGPLVTTVKEGDRVLFGRFSGFPFSLDKVQHVLVVEEEVLGHFEAPTPFWP